MPNLNKPDMPAVLERTHLAAHFDAFLLPVYEAGSNSIHALLDKYGGAESSTKGRLVFSFSIGNSPEEFSVTISDNAFGLDETNYHAFLTPFTGNKLKRGGKGFGRFVAFKIFNEVSYYSKARTASGSVDNLSFKFNIYDDEEIKIIEGGIPPDFETGCAVTYCQVKPQYHHRWEELTEERILDHLSSNFLTYLVDGRMPHTTVQIGGSDFDLRSHFAKVFKHEKTHKFTLEIRGESYEFKCDVSRSERGKPFSRHALMFLQTIVCLGQDARLKTN
jgi:hypothetical protein